MRISDWSSDVCSSDLGGARWRKSRSTLRQPISTRSRTRARTCPLRRKPGDSNEGSYSCGRIRHPHKRGKLGPPEAAGRNRRTADRKSVVRGKRVSVRVDVGGRRNNKKKKTERR